jgi:hypothetical protein
MNERAVDVLDHALRDKPAAAKLTPELGHRRRSSKKEIVGAAAPLGCHPPMDKESESSNAKFSMAQ